MDAGAQKEAEDRLGKKKTKSDKGINRFANKIADMEAR